MSSFFASRGVLFTAWGVVLLLLGGGLALAFLQPPPPPGGEPVSLVLNLPPPPAADDLQDGAAPAPEMGAAEGEEAPPPADTAPVQPPAGDAPEQVQGEGGAGGAPENGSDQPEAAETAQAVPEESSPEGEYGAAEADASGQQIPEPDTAPAASEEPQGPPAPATIALPSVKPTPQEIASPQAEDPSPAKPDGAGRAAVEQAVAIPLIPPAPEELPYWERYRQPFNMQDSRPRIAVVLTGLGLSDSATEAAINKLPSAMTLSFSPYARDLERWIALARARGHEVMMDLPMEPATFPNEDPGPQGLLTNLSAEDNLDRLDWVLSRGSAYVGLAGSMGSRFTASRQAMEPILRDLKQRGLMFLDRRTTENSVAAALAGEIGLPIAVNNRSVDERQASRVAIDARLAQIERIALTEGFAVAMAQPYPVTLDRLAEWATELTDRGFVIAPISALANQQQRE